jgi:hypothetical protein
MFMYASDKHIFRADCADLVSHRETSQKQWEEFNRLKTDTLTDIVDGDWESWEVKIESTERFIFSRNGHSCLALIKDRAYVLGVSFAMFINTRNIPGVTERI